MKALIGWSVALAVLCTGSAQAQGIAGTWQGTLQAGKELRLVFAISEAEGTLKATMYSIDQASQGLVATSITLQGATLRVSIGGIAGSYEGTLNADRTSMAGTWTQGGGSLPLTLRRATPDTAWAIPEAPKPMAADAPARFEVASVKASNPDRPGGKLFTVKGRQVLTMNTTVNDLITFAYGLHARQITGGQSWLDSEKYDVTGQPEASGIPNTAQLREMMKHLLADRFNLVFHRESKEQSVYAIVVAEGGPKLTKNDSNPKGLPGLFFRGLGVLPGVNATMADLAEVMQTAVLDRPVVDKTGLQGRYDFTLTWTPDETQFAQLGARVPPPPPNDPNAPPSLGTAFREQLGLRLESARAPVDLLIIDRIERPSEN